MGNNNSSEAKTYKILYKEEGTESIKFFLDTGRGIFDEAVFLANRSPFNKLKAGDSLKIDLIKARLNWARGTCGVFDERFVKGVEIRNSDSNSNIISDTLEFGAYQAEIHQRYQALIEDRRFVNQMQRNTSYDMPPK